MAGLRARQKHDRGIRIVEAAAGLFQERGFQETTMQEVASRSGLAVGTLYNYFRSKTDLGLALVRRDTDAGLAAAERIVKRPPADPARALAAFMQRALAPFARHERKLWRELVSAALRDAQLAGGLFTADLRLLDQLATLVRALQGRGTLRSDVDAGRVAVVLYGGFLTWFLAYVSTDDISLSTVRTEIGKGIEVVVRGLLPKITRGGKVHDDREGAQRPLHRGRYPHSRLDTR
jgi:AcrR family transcriptional regulator